MLRFLMIAIIGWYVFSPIQASIAQAPVPPPLVLKDLPVEEIVKYYATEYHVDSSQLIAVMKCESGGKQTAVGDNGAAHGIFQFHAQTFLSFAERMGEKLDRESAVDQSKMAAWAWANKLQSHWSCAKSLGFVR